MRLRFLAKLFHRPSKVARASADAVPTQAIGDHRRSIRLATLNGLLVAVKPEDRSKYEEAVARVLRMRGSA